MKNLKVLNLNSNKLQGIQPGTFDQLEHLESLDLSSNNLKTLESNAINVFKKLQILNLAGNQLKTISSDILDPFKVLKIVDLSNNDCINLSFPEVTLMAIKQQINEDCVAPVEVECFILGLDYNEVEEVREVEFDCIAVHLTIKHPNTKISKLKNKIDSDSFTFSIIDQHIAYLPFQLSKIFTNLHIFVVVRSKLTALNQRNFEGLTSLKNITILNNNISLIVPGVFDDVPQLEYLKLSFNNIQNVPAMMFRKLIQLKILNLSDNHLTSFDTDILPPDNAIKEFYIGNNKLSEIDKKIFTVLKRAKVIDLTENFCIDMKYEAGVNIRNVYDEIELRCSKV